MTETYSRSTDKKGTRRGAAAETETPSRRSRRLLGQQQQQQQQQQEDQGQPDLAKGDMDYEPKYFSEKEKMKPQNEPHYEFGGPLGALGVIVGLPIVIYSLYFACNAEFCLASSSANTDSSKTNSYELSGLLASLPTSASVLWSAEGWAMYLGWMLFNVILERLLPGEVTEGAPLPEHSADPTNSTSKTVASTNTNTNPTRLKYTLSGHLQFWLCILAMGHAIPLLQVQKEVTGAVGWFGAVVQVRGFMPLRLDLIYDHYVPLITASVVFSFALSVYLYVTSFYPKGKLLAKGGNTGNAVYDFFIGRELNPRIGTLDLKEFCELRPGLVGWLVINLGMATKQFVKRKAATGVGSVSMSMVGVTVLQGLYVWDALYNEKAILTTMDITTDGFGYMLAFGDLSWVPFIYSLQARYLVDYDPQLSLFQLALIFAVQFLGYYIFRSANSQKDAFRRDPNGDEVKHLHYLTTKRGTRLLTSGWWGMARKINYTGDWLITFSWCLLCGFSSPIPYFQAVYFLVLLVHRAMRDDQMCREKYGDDWEEYRRQVPYMFVPYLI